MMNLKRTFSVALVLFCTAHFSFAQDKTDKIVTVGYEACDCIGKISTAIDDEAKSVEIKTCIESANMMYQLKNSLFGLKEKLADTLPKLNTGKTIDSLTIESKDIDMVITIDEDYQEIEDYLMETCGDMKSIYFSNDIVTSKKSISKKEEAMVYYSLGIEADEAQDYIKAVEYYKKALEIDKKFAFAWDNLGMAYRGLNRNEDAVKAYKKSLKLDPKGKTPLMNIGVAYQQLGQYDNAIKYYNKFKKIYKKDPEAYYGLGRMYFEKRELMPAVDNMMQAYRLYIEMDSPYKQDAAANLGAMYDFLEKEGKLDIFRAAAKKNKINLDD